MKDVKLRKTKPTTPEEYLETLSTRELLSLKSPNIYFSRDGVFYGTWPKNAVSDDPRIVHFECSEDQLLAELAKRPHVPNKNESRGLHMKKIKKLKGSTKKKLKYGR